MLSLVAAETYGGRFLSRLWPSGILIILISTTSMNAAGPSVTLSSLEEHGVVLVASSDPDFAAGLNPGRSPDFDLILPYTAVIKNNTDREVIAYVVLWYCTATDGRTVTQTRNVANFANLRPGAHLRPKTSELVSLLPGVESGQQWDGSTQRLLDFYLSQKKILISLDAVLFDDGAAVGPDHSRWIEKWQAWLDAEQTVFSAAATASLGATSIVQGLAQHARDVYRTQFGSEANYPGHFSTLADRSQSYSECFEWAKGYFALSMAQEIEARGEAVVMKNINAHLQSKKYPKVHRKEQVQ
jgi:hypothetical protein